MIVGMTEGSLNSTQVRVKRKKPNLNHFNSYMEVHTTNLHSAEPSHTFQVFPKNLEVAEGRSGEPRGPLSAHQALTKWEAASIQRLWAGLQGGERLPKEEGQEWGWGARELPHYTQTQTPGLWKREIPAVQKICRCSDPKLQGKFWFNPQNIWSQW